MAQTKLAPESLEVEINYQNPEPVMNAVGVGDYANYVIVDGHTPIEALKEI